MAITVFSKQNGMVSSFNDPSLPARTTLKVEGWNGFAGFKSIITRVTVSAQGNYQFLHTLGGNIFIYVFGDRIGQLSISGLAFDSTCGDAAGTIGIERVLNFYSSNRVAARGTPMKVTIGTSTTLAGYLVGVAADVADPKSKIYQFNLQMILAPTSGRSCSPNQSSSQEEGAGDAGDGGDADDGGEVVLTPAPDAPGIDTITIGSDGSYGGGAITRLGDTGAIATDTGYTTYGIGPDGVILP